MRFRLWECCKYLLTKKWKISQRRMRLLLKAKEQVCKSKDFRQQMRSYLTMIMLPRIFLRLLELNLDTTSLMSRLDSRIPKLVLILRMTSLEPFKRWERSQVKEPTQSGQSGKDQTWLSIIIHIHSLTQMLSISKEHSSINTLLSLQMPRPSNKELLESDSLQDSLKKSLSMKSSSTVFHLTRIM